MTKKPKEPASPVSDWERNLYDKLVIFAKNWANYQGTEQAGAQQFLHRLLEYYDVSYAPGTIFEQHPVRIPTVGKRAQTSLFGDESAPAFTTERMDMYLPKVCVWEMKAPSETNLEKHHEQLLRYWSRVRTRYMVLCNFREFLIYDTNDEGGQLTPKLRFPLSELPANSDALIFLRGDVPDLAGRAERITSEVASRLGRLVREVIASSNDTEGDRERVAKFVLECVFAMFAEDTDLTPPKLFTNAVRRADEANAMDPVWTLFDDFAREEASDRHNRFAPYVDGPLFDCHHPKLALTDGQIHDLHTAARDFDWQDVRPEIFGSIFEQALDPDERHELGAHFTREEDIAKVVGPSVIEPWRTRIRNLRTLKDADQAIADMKAFHVLDPACGCGNFLYVVYREMKRLEAGLAKKWYEILRYKVAKRKSDIHPPPPGPYFTIDQLHGIEKNSFAAFLARVVLWIGEHLANRELGLGEETLPLKNLDANVVEGDALFVDWPRPEGALAIVGNPPYLGVRKMRQEMGDIYVDALFEKYPDNRAADYVTYWFTRALDVLRPSERAGFVCTNSVAQNESREASIDKIAAKGGSITDAWKSYPWPGEAAVHVGVVNWIMAAYHGIRTLDGQETDTISPGLTEAIDVTAARPLANTRLCFMGVTPGNTEFVLTDAEREAILADDPKSDDVIKPFLVGRDVNREVDQAPTRWIIDFGTMELEEAERFKGAMRNVRKHVYPVRVNNRRKAYAENWWRFVEPRPALREAIENKSRVLVIPCVAPHLIVSRQPYGVCFDHQLMVIALSHRYHFGILQSRMHSIWAWSRGSTLEERLRYTNTTIFETFPFPRQPDGRYLPRIRPRTKEADRVAEAAEAFDKLRTAACREQKLGLTKLHNQIEKGEPPELRAAYDELNDAVTACYGFPKGTWRDDRETLRLLLNLNHRVAGG